MLCALMASTLVLAPPPADVPVQVPVQRPKALGPDAVDAPPPATPDPETAPAPIPEPSTETTHPDVPEPSTSATHPDVPPPGAADATFDPPAAGGSTAPVQPQPQPQAAPPQVIPAPVPMSPPPVDIRPRPPGSGNGLLVGGSLMSFGAVGLIAVSSVMLGIADSPQQRLNAAFGLVPGLGLGVSGGFMVARGVKNHRRYKEFRLQTGINPPHQGGGLIVGGIAAIVPGLITAVSAGFLALDPVARQTPIPGILGGSSAALFVAGGSMLGVGIVKAKRYNTWLNGPYLHMPVAAPIRGGGIMSISGSF